MYKDYIELKIKILKLMNN